jgi:hypothetical protein
MCVNNKKENNFIRSLEGLGLDKTCYCFSSVDGGNQSIKIWDYERYIERDNDWHLCGKQRLKNN